MPRTTAIGRTSHGISIHRRSGSPHIDGIEAAALRAGWYVAPGRRRLVRVGGLIFLLLAGVGLVRIVVGSAAGFPVGYLLVLTAVGLIFGLVLR